MRRIFERLACGGGLRIQLALDQFLDDAVVALGGAGGIARQVQLLVRYFLKLPPPQLSLRRPPRLR